VHTVRFAGHVNTKHEEVITMTMPVPTQKEDHSNLARPRRVSPEPAGRSIGIAPVPFRRLGAGRRLFLSAHYLVHQEAVTEETATTLVECEEVLVVDPRGMLTPAQMVDQKLLALLGSCSRSLHPAGGKARRGTEELGRGRPSTSPMASSRAEHWVRDGFLSPPPPPEEPTNAPLREEVHV
jgi:hypothetical protein